MNNYTDEYLLRFMFEPIMVVINCTSSYNQAYAKLEYDQPTGKAMISTGWKDTVEKHNLQVGDICVFSFRDESKHSHRDPNAWLRIVIDKLKA
jgi:hypothetical protein